MPEVRLIDANAAADKIMRETENRADDLNIIGIALMIGIARMLRDENDFPTIKSEPVRHGRWIPVDGEPYAKCSYCGEKHYGCTTPYCDMCGAYMRKVGAGNA
jgi:hypothetical protein